MSHVCTIEGELRFTNKEEFDKALDAFNYGGFDSVESSAGNDAYIITIPFGTYRNFFRIEDETLGRASTYGVIWTSADGEFTGGYKTEDKSETFNLNMWAVENGFEPFPPDFETEKAFEEYVDWQTDVEQAFFGEHANNIPDGMIA